MHRRNFIRAISGTLLLLSNGSIIRAGGLADKKVVFRFVVASDGHYGEEHTDFHNYYKNIVKSINAFHSSNSLNAVVINGDIIHNIPSFLPDAERELKQLQVPFYVTRGNHDRVSADVWQSTWNMPLNHSVVIQDQIFLLGDTSNEQGKYLTPNMDFFSKHLKEYKSAKNIFIFLHITPVKWTENAVDGTDFQKLILQHNNIRVVFNGHDHDQDNVKMLGRIPFLFDGHFGGSWGTDYQGFRVVELLEDNSIRSFIMNPLVRLNDFYIIQE